MNSILPILLLALCTGVGGLMLGGILAFLLRQKEVGTAGTLVGFTAGVMLAVSCFHMIPEAFEHSEGALLPAGGLLSGFAVTWILDHRIGHGGHGHGDLHAAGLVLAAAVALHNMPVGMALGATGAVDGLTLAVCMTAAVVALHNIPEGMSIAAPLLSGGASPRLAVGLSALSGIPTVLGAWLGFYLGSAAPLLLVVSLALAAGAMLYVIFLELLPEALSHEKRSRALLLFGVGFLLGLLFLRFGGHSH